MRGYTYKDMVYVGKKLYFLTPGKKYQIMNEYLDGSIIAMSYIGDDGKTHMMYHLNDLRFVEISEWRDKRLNELGI